MSNGSVPDVKDLIRDDTPAQTGKMPSAGDLIREGTEQPGKVPSTGNLIGGDEGEPDEGYLPAVGRAARGFATGLEKFSGQAAPYLPFVPGATASGMMARHELARTPPPKDPVEAGFQTVGEVLPTFAIPGFAPARAARFGIPLAKQTLESMAKGAMAGGVGGALMQEGDTGKNMTTGAATGMLTGTLGAVYNALPWSMKNTMNMAAAAYAANSLKHLGIDQWWIQAPVFWKLYTGGLADLVAKWSNRLAPGVGASAAQGRRLYTGDDDGRTD